MCMFIGKRNGNVNYSQEEKNISCLNLFVSFLLNLSIKGRRNGTKLSLVRSCFFFRFFGNLYTEHLGTKSRRH